MKTIGSFHINGAWATPAAGSTLADVINPATEQCIGHVAMGTAEDADRAVAAAQAALSAWSQSSREERIALLERVVDQYRLRLADIAGNGREFGAVGLAEFLEWKTVCA
ncbi:Aldehyde dehydrogenase (fragment) [Cupriavidus necator]|uniref:Aldehyde dehydrogenase n=1 Tax=Cupriavidus necator TaxID=106590 RepID=A0A1K0IF28_CUPNE